MKIAFYSPSGEDLYRYRLPVARRLAEVGYGVVLIGPEGEYADAVEKAGFSYHRFRASDEGVPPFGDVSSGVRLGSVYRDEMPDIVHHFSLRGIFHGGMAARISGISWVVQSVTSLHQEDGGAYLLRPGLRSMMRAALRNAQVTFASPQDRQVLINKGCVRPEQTHIIRSSGVDLDAFPFNEEPDRIPVVVLTGPLDRTTEIEAFVQAACTLRGEGVQARFALVSTVRDRPSIPRADLETWQEEGLIEWWGYRDNVARTMSNVHVVCMPSYSDDEIPRVLVEAASTGRAMVAADVPACSDLVRPGETGLLIQPGNADDLTAALRRLITDADTRRRFGRRARELVETEFSADRVARETMAVYERLYEQGRMI